MTAPEMMLGAAAKEEEERGKKEMSLRSSGFVHFWEMALRVRGEGDQEVHQGIIFLNTSFVELRNWERNPEMGRKLVNEIIFVNLDMTVREQEKGFPPAPTTIRLSFCAFSRLLLRCLFARICSG